MIALRAACDQAHAIADANVALFTAVFLAGGIVGLAVGARMWLRNRANRQSRERVWAGIEQTVEQRARQAGVP